MESGKWKMENIWAVILRKSKGAHLLLCALLAVAMVVFTAIGASASWIDNVTDESGLWRYKLTDDGATIMGRVNKPTGDLTIPSALDGHAVTSIGEFAFSMCSNLTSVTIPDSVTSIGGWAFSDCDSLANVTIPSNMTSISEFTFQSSGLTSVTIPNGVTNIGRRAFDDCNSLMSVIIGDGVTSIGEEAFFRCSSLTNVTIPESVTSIDTNPFVYCPLTYVDVAPNNPIYEQIEGVLFDKQQKMLLCYPGAREGAYTIPEGVLLIGDCAFESCNGLTNITIPDSVRSIGDNAFAYSNGLTNVTIPNNVASIGDCAFYGCGSLISVTIPASVTSIGDWAFECDNLTLTVTEGSVAEQYAKQNGIPYVFSSDAP